MLLLLACAEPQNHPPEFVISTYAEGSTIEIPTVGIEVSVTADDPDGDPMVFTWSAGGTSLQSAEQENASDTTSTYLVSGAGMDGLTLECAVSDGVDEISISWPLVYTGS